MPGRMARQLTDPLTTLTLDQSIDRSMGEEMPVAYVPGAPRLSRRAVLRLLGTGGGLTLLVACGPTPQAPQPTPAPAAKPTTPAAAATTAPAPAATAPAPTAAA